MHIPELTEWALRLDDLSVERGRGSGAVRAVDGVSASVRFGGALCVSGTTGSGKSSLAAILTGQRETDSRIVGGSATVCGISARHPGRARSVLSYRVGYVAQDAGPRLNPDMTVGDVIVEPIVSREPRIDRQRLEVRVSTLLDEVRLPLGASGKFPHELSAGMRQRVALARALVMDPRLLVADEPLAGIDVEVRHVVRDAVQRRRAEWGMAALVVTNDSSFAREIGADQIVLDQGVPVTWRAAGEDPVVTPGAEHSLAFIEA